MKSRRSILKAGAAMSTPLALAPIGLSATARTFANTAVTPAIKKHTSTDQILVVVELSGGNDGLNTVVPHGDAAYYQHRPTIGIARKALHSLDEQYGFNPGALGLKRLWDTGDLAVVHGCGYDNPSYSHFSSAAYWHTATPNSGHEFGWLGRLADALQPNPNPNMLVGIGSAQTLAIKSQVHSPVVFDDPLRFQRNMLAEQRRLLAQLAPSAARSNAHSYMNDVAASAQQASQLVRQAWRQYQPKVDYGVAPMDLPKVAACIAAGLPTQIYHVAFRNNAFDTHVQQPALHQRLLSYACDGLHGFIRELEAMGEADRVVVLVHSEFGRRVGENANGGTDHGSANLMFLAGKPVCGGHYGTAPDLTKLRADDNLHHSVDFRQVYATAIDGWLGGAQTPPLSTQVLGSSFTPLSIFDCKTNRIST